MIANLVFLLLIHAIAWGWVPQSKRLDHLVLLRGPSVVAIPILSLTGAFTGGMRAVLIAVLAMVWGARWTAHQLARERVVGPSRRLAEWQASAGSAWQRQTLIRWALPQAVLLWLCTVSIQRGILDSAPFPGSLLDFLGVVLVSVGLGFEALADHQLFEFQQQPSNEEGVLSTGLWAWSRHPNHFGTLVVSLRFYLLAASGGDGLWSLAGPAATAVVVGRVLPSATVEQARGARRTGYEKYRWSTSALFPKPPKDLDRAPMPEQTLRYLDTPESEPSATERPDLRSS